MSTILIVLALLLIPLAFLRRGFFGILGWLYLTRVSLIGLIALLCFPLAAHGPVRELAIGVFDLRQKWGGLAVGALLPLAAWTVFLAGALVVAYGERRTSFNVSPPPHWILPVMRTLLWVAMAINVWTIYFATDGDDRPLVMSWLIPGFFIGLALTWGVEEWHRRFSKTWLGGNIYFLPHAGRKVRLEEVVDRQRTQRRRARGDFMWRGYVEFNERGEWTPMPGHLLAAAAAAVFVLANVAIYFTRRSADGELTALVYLLVVFIALILALGGLTFFMDAYRLPVLSVLAIWLVVVGKAPNSDHVYRIWPREDPVLSTEKVMTPAQVLEEAGRTGSPIVLVAIAGGGIQSAVWSTQVLTGLEKAVQDARKSEEFRALPGFANSVQCLSGVSGGSVGAMFFVASYGPNGLPPPRTLDRKNEVADPQFLDRIVAAAGDTSLGQAVWGLAYVDSRRAWFPFGMNNMYLDRATKMEQKWANNGLLAMTNQRGTPVFDMKLQSATLAGWQEDVCKGLRPAIIFNGTIVETGERIAFSTAPSDRFYEGQREFVTFKKPNSTFDPSLYPGADVHITTAARLSATFPFVSPAGRPCVARSSDERENGIFQPEGSHANLIPNKNGLYHVVDGGYYDNTGLSALTQWLDDGLTSLAKSGSKHWPRSILILSLDGFPEDFSASETAQIQDRSDKAAAGKSTAPAPQTQSERGAIFQFLSPVAALCNVRGAAHDAFAQRNFDTHQARWTLVHPSETKAPATCDIQLVKFTMPLLPRDEKNRPWWKPAWSEATPERPPLSWHLREVEKRHVADAWMALLNESRLLPNRGAAGPSDSLEEMNPGDPRIRPVDSVIKFLQEASKRKSEYLDPETLRRKTIAGGE